MNTQFNLIHAVVYSIGLHIIAIGFSPPLKNEVPVKFEKSNEKIRLKITKKPETKVLKPTPVAISPVTAMSKKHFVEPEVSLIPIKVNLDQQINPSTMKTSPKISKNIKSIRPVSSRISNLVHSSIRTAHVYNTHSKPLIQDVRIHKSQIKNTQTIDRKFISKSSNQNKLNFMKTTFHPKPRTKVPENRLSHSVGVARKTYKKTYYENNFTPELRNVEKVRIAKKIIEIDFEKLWSKYSYLIRMKVASAKIYPESARVKNHQGKAILSLKLGKDGSILKVSVGSSSGHKALDQAAIDAIKDAAPYPKIPDKLNKQYVLLKLPITFILN